MNYNKKQMQPLIDKYQINPETNKLFISVVDMFNGQPNYQIWAVKCVFNKAVTFDELAAIHNWIEKNQTMIKNLEKKNIVSYSSRPAIIMLQQEMKGIDMLNVIKDVISHFNTDQRKMLTDSIIPTGITPLAAFNEPNIIKWADIFTRFNRLPMSRKNNFYTKSSGIREIEQLKSLIIGCLDYTYTWDKEDMIAFMQNNASDCEIVYDNGPYVIVHVPSFQSSMKLCGSGRTQWCITMEESHFRDYVQPRGMDNNDQYFLFDFSRKETDSFAHIGFTIKKGSGIIYAQTCENEPMIDNFESNSGEVLNIHEALKRIGADPSKFLKINKNKAFDWTIVSFLEYASKNASKFTVALEKDNCVIVKVSSYDAFKEVTSHTMIPCDEIFFDDKHAIYMLFDFNLQYNDEGAIIALMYGSDLYGSLSFTHGYNLVGKKFSKIGELHKDNIKQSDFISCDGIEPRVMLHKLIDEGDENGAIELIDKNGKDFDVNFEFNMRLPIFSAISNNMIKLFKKIINHPKFDNTCEDAFGDSILQTLLYIYGSGDVNITKERKNNLVDMIKIILSSKTFDFNTKDINLDTAIIFCCQQPETAWVTEELVKNKNVDINCKNDAGMTPLSCAIYSNSTESIKALGMRPDLIVTPEDMDLAKKHKIDLSSLIKPSNDIFSEMNILEYTEQLLNFAMSETV